MLEKHSTRKDFGMVNKIVYLTLKIVINKSINATDL
jgi:hypothetical protein